jgi:pimeloyl-ACP methyl ester carboxylesterase
VVVAAAMGVGIVLAVPTVRAADTGPELTEPADALAASLACSPGLAGATKDPVLLVHGTSSDPRQFDWNWIPALDADGIPYCTVAMVDAGLGDVQLTGERIVHAVRTMHAAAGRKIDIVGHSQGGMAPRWALKFWPDTRAMVDDLVGIAASNHGTQVIADATCAATCQPSIWQQRAGSAFIAALNDGAETWAGIDYTQVFTHYDEIVIHNLDDSGSTSLHTGDGTIANVATQDVCPLSVAEHLSIGTYDPVGYAVARDAMDNPGPAVTARVPASVCAQLLMPGVNPATFVADYAATVGALAGYLATGARVPAEPTLACYVNDTCAAAAETVPPPADPAAGGDTPAVVAGTSQARGTLAATGGPPAVVPALGAVAALLALALRRVRVEDSARQTATRRTR